MSPHFRTAVAKAVLPRPGSEEHGLSGKVFALARDKFADDDVVLHSVFRDPRFSILFIEVQLQFDQIPTDTQYDALSYRGWFRRERAGGGLIPISASLASFSTAQGRLPRYTPIGILRLGGSSIWAMSEWGIESQTIVLFDISAKEVRKLTSTDIGGC